MRIWRWMFIGFIAIALILSFIPYSQSLYFLDQMPEVCPLKRWIGLQCAFCGMTHAWVAILHGKFQEAYQYNALSIPLFLITIITLFVLSLGYRTATKSYLKRRNPAIWLIILGLIAYALIRNV